MRLARWCTVILRALEYRDFNNHSTYPLITKRLLTTGCMLAQTPIKFRNRRRQSDKLSKWTMKIITFYTTRLSSNIRKWLLTVRRENIFTILHSVSFHSFNRIWIHPSWVHAPSRHNPILNVNLLSLTFQLPGSPPRRLHLCTVWQTLLLWTRI